MPPPRVAAEAGAGAGAGWEPQRFFVRNVRARHKGGRRRTRRTKRGKRRNSRGGVHPLTMRKNKKKARSKRTRPYGLSQGLSMHTLIETLPKLSPKKQTPRKTKAQKIYLQRKKPPPPRAPPTSAKKLKFEW